jgi:hypothetical protein
VETGEKPEEEVWRRSNDGVIEEQSVRRKTKKGSRDRVTHFKSRLEVRGGGKGVKFLDLEHILPQGFEAQI